MSSPFERAEVAETYEDWLQTPYGRLVKQIEVELIVDGLAPLSPGASLLDVGCGTGWLGLELRERGFRVTGVDMSSAMLARAQSRFTVVRGDAMRLPFADRSFDGAYVTAVLDFVSDPVAVLAEARRVARERVVVMALASGSWLAWRRRFAGWRGHPIFGQAQFYSRRRLFSFARQAGAEPDNVSGALVLPPAVSTIFPAIELALRGRSLPGVGLVAFSLPGTKH